jgi:sugar (pentulose or hexulose) kinase
MRTTWELVNLTHEERMREAAAWRLARAAGTGGGARPARLVDSFAAALAARLRTPAPSAPACLPGAC